MPIWARLVAEIAALRVAAALALYLSGQTSATPPTPIPLVAYAGLSLTFGALGTLLVVANRDDVRASWLGGILLLIAVPMTRPFFTWSSMPVAWIDHLRPDAFLTAFLWFFVIEFPTRLTSVARRAAETVAVVTAAIGAAAFAINLSILPWPAEPDALGWRALLAGGPAPGTLYWPTVFLPSTAAFLALLGRTVAASGAERRRLQIFVGGIVAGLLPLVADVLIEESWPAFKTWAHTPAVEPWMGLLLFGALAIVPCVTAYSVVFDRVVEMRVVVRTALQYLLARYTILVISALPFIALGVYIARIQTSSRSGALFSELRPQALLVGVLVGAVALRKRKSWLEALDHRFFREQYDAHLLLARVMSGDFISQRPVAIAERLRTEFERTLHARADLFVLDESGPRLRDPRGERRALDAKATLVGLALADTQPLDLQSEGPSVLKRLGESERAWLTDGGYKLIAALPSRSGAPLGLLTLGEKRSGLPFSTIDRRTLLTLAPPIALAIENDRLRLAVAPSFDEAAMECPACARLHAPASVRCACGSALAESRAPHLLRGVFRFDRRIGAGSMGVVYHAVDVNLRREVAVKTLPRVTAEHVDLLQREAQAMASIVHPNLAVIYGIESWRDTPFLVEEYLSGGTLADRLSDGRLRIDTVLSLGVTLAGVLGQLHEAGMVHCDIKPSNIGFSESGIVKLLDFGLVYLLRDSHEALELTLNASGAQETTSTMVTHRGLVGTPAYMSPEAINARSPAPSFDLWALAVVLYEALAGTRPFEGGNAHAVFASIAGGVFPDLRTVRVDCPDDVAQFFNRALAPDLATRPKDARALAHDLSTLRQTEV